MDDTLNTTMALGSLCSTLGTVTYMLMRNKKTDVQIKDILERLAKAEKDIKDDKFNFASLEKLLQKFENDRERIFHLTTQVAALLNGERIARLDPKGQS